MNLHVGTTGNNITFTLVEHLNSESRLLNEAFRDELINFGGILGHTRELINEVTVANKVSDRHVLNFEKLCDVLMLINIDIEVLKLAIVLLHCINEHWLEDVARSAPAGTSLDQDWTFAVL